MKSFIFLTFFALSLATPAFAKGYNCQDRAETPISEDNAHILTALNQSFSMIVIMIYLIALSMTQLQQVVIWIST